MNDNIQKLCAELLHYDDMIFGWQETVERAAKAIVLECCEIVRNSSLPDSYSEACLEYIADELEEHFGVK